MDGTICGAGVFIGYGCYTIIKCVLQMQIKLCKRKYKAM